MAHPGQVFPAEQIYENVWQETADYNCREYCNGTYPSYQGKVEIDAKKPRYVKVVWELDTKWKNMVKSN